MERATLLSLLSLFAGISIFSWYIFKVVFVILYHYDGGNLCRLSHLPCAIWWSGWRKRNEISEKAALNGKINVPFSSHEILFLSSIKFSINFFFSGMIGLCLNMLCVLHYDLTGVWTQWTLWPNCLKVIWRPNAGLGVTRAKIRLMKGTDIFGHAWGISTCTTTSYRSCF